MVVPYFICNLITISYLIHKLISCQLCFVRRFLYFLLAIFVTAMGCYLFYLKVFLLLQITILTLLPCLNMRKVQSSCQIVKCVFVVSVGIMEDWTDLVQRAAFATLASWEPIWYANRTESPVPMCWAILEELASITFEWQLFVETFTSAGGSSILSQI